MILILLRLELIFLLIDKELPLATASPDKNLSRLYIDVTKLQHCCALVVPLCKALLA